MICAKGHYSADKLFCPTCLVERSAEGFRRLQMEFLRKVARGEFSYSLRVEKGNQRHVLMFTSETRAFCGKELEAKPKIDYLPYNDETLGKVCAGCRSEIASLMFEVVP